MKRFAQLILAIDTTTRTTEKRDALIAYFEEASDADKLWCVALLSGKRPKRPVKAALLRQWAAEQGGIPLWLFEESYYVVGDLAETVALLLPPANSGNEVSLSTRMLELSALRQMAPDEVRAFIKGAWNEMNSQERFVFNKLITGGFRIGVSQRIMVKALAVHLDEDESKVAHRLMGNWSPQDDTFENLLASPDPAENLSRPYPFYLAYPIEGEPSALGAASEWQFEYKWDGIRGQLIFRKGKLFLWSRGEELITERFPEFSALTSALPADAVIDGEIMAFKEGSPLSFNHLQSRIGRKKPSKKVMEHAPAVLMAYDLIEYNGHDLRTAPLVERQALLAELLAQTNSSQLLLSMPLTVNSWEEAVILRENCRTHLAEGLMVKRKNSSYKVGRKRGDWWKWKVDPLTIDAVLIYAMRGHGRRANLFSDYTFAVWDGDALVPFAKAYSGLTDIEMKKVDQFVKANTLERFGPVRSVKPELVFEIGFEGIANSPRHKSGIALRFPRMLRWRLDKNAAEANTLQDLKDFLINDSHP
jgi:DNA ligase-1